MVDLIGSINLNWLRLLVALLIVVFLVGLGGCLCWLFLGQKSRRLLENPSNNAQNYSEELLTIFQTIIADQAPEESIVKELLTIFNCDYSYLLELLPNESAFFLKAGSGWEKGLVGSAHLSNSPESLAGYTLTHKQAVIIEDLRIETRFRGGPLLDNHGITSGISIAIPTSYKPYGIIGVFSKKTREFTSSEIKILEFLGKLLGFILDNYHQQEHLNLLERALNATENGVIITDALQIDNPVIYLNQGFEKITGYSRAEMLGANCRILQGPETDKETVRNLNKAILQGEDYHGTVLNYRQDGRKFWNELDIAPIYNSSGYLTNFIGIQNDITERKSAEDALKESEERFRLIFEQAAVGIALVGRGGNFLKVNQKACEIWGYTAAELSRIKITDLGVNLEDNQHNQEQTYLKKDGSLIWCNGAVSLVKNSLEPYYILVIADITKKKQIAEELSLFNRHLQYFHKVSTQFSQDLEKALNNYLKAGCEIFDLSTGIISKVEGEDYQLIAMQSPVKAVLLLGKLQLSETYCSRVIKEQKTISYRQVNQNKTLAGYAIEAYLGTPIWVNGEIYGTLNFSGTTPRLKEFRSHEYAIIELMAESLGKLISHKLTEQRSLESESRLNSILHSLEDVVWSLSADGQKLLYINPAVEKLYGYPVAAFQENHNLFLQRIHPEDLERVKQARQKLKEKNFNKDLEYRIIKANGEVAWIRSRIKMIEDENGQPLRFDGLITDITQSKQAAEELRQERDLLNAITETSVAAIAVVDITGQIIFANEKAEEVLAISKEELLTRNYDSLVWKITDPYGNPLASEELPFEKVIKQKAPIFNFIHAIQWPDHTLRFLSINGAPLTHAQGELRGAVFSVTDITEQRLLEQRLIHNAFYDPLTKLPNRLLLMDLLTEAINRTKQDCNYLFAVLFLDLDRFKLVNDSLGHQAGDQLLIGFARRLEKCLRSTDTVVRLGGDEFAILLENLKEEEEAIQIASRIQTVLEVPFNFDGHEVFTTVSIGITYSSFGYDHGADLLRDADLSMYRAKENGRSGYQIFVKTMHTELLNRLQLENELRGAVERQQLQLYYQPIIALDSEKLIGFEALLRWFHPYRGYVSPAEFVPLAEETGLIVPMGEWVLTEACRQLHQWIEQYPRADNLTISVNLSGRQLKQSDLVLKIDEILKNTGLNQRFLKLEITESILMENIALVSEILEEVKNRQITLCLDDFGTGYSSLSYLHRFPVSILKIDQSFVRQIGINDDKLAIIRGIVALAHSLEMQVIAEGIETWGQFAFLKQIGCEYGQGFFFSRPLAPERVEKCLQDWIDL